VNEKRSTDAKPAVHDAVALRRRKGIIVPLFDCEREQRDVVARQTRLDDDPDTTTIVIKFNRYRYCYTMDSSQTRYSTLRLPGASKYGTIGYTNP